MQTSTRQLTYHSLVVWFTHKHARYMVVRSGGRRTRKPERFGEEERKQLLYNDLVFCTCLVSPLYLCWASLASRLSPWAQRC
jgi:hypothetical protein